VVLELSVLKGDAMEWVVEKAVELGVSALVPVLAERTVVQMGRKGPESFRERWQKIADQALKQCGRLDRMAIGVPSRLEELLRNTPPAENRIYFDEEARAEAPTLWGVLTGGLPQTPVRLLIGPEGGWAPPERRMIEASRAQSASLGPLVLRAETAAIAAVSLLTAALRDRVDPG
jgi:16S rRNA (uracil1498-N3)-methyltransferase